MNNTMILLLLAVLIQPAAGQSVQTVQPYTRGNRIELTIANGSSRSAAGPIEVRVVEHPEVVTFNEVDQMIETIPPQGERMVSFGFDVGRPERPMVNTTDTIKVLVRDGHGTTWEKFIVVRYALPTTFALEQNYPNPFNPTTTIRYQVPINSRVRLKVYDVLGREVVTIVDEEKAAGYHEEVFDASHLASGVYFYRFVASAVEPPGAGSFTAVRKLLVVK
jgi:hypothetical protein